MNKSRKLFMRLMCIFLALLMAVTLILTALPARAVSQAEIDALEEEKEALEAAAEELQGNIDSMEEEHARYIDRKEALDRQILNNAEEIRVMNEQIELYEQQMAETREKLAAATSAEGEQYTQLRSRMRAMEENGTLSYIDILFNADSLTDFLSRVTDITQIMQHDQQLRQEYTTARQDVESLKAQLENAQTQQQAIRAELEFKQQQMEAQTQAAYEMIANLENDLEAYNKAFEENEEAEKALQDEIDELMEKLRKQEAAAAAAAAAQGGGGGGGSANTGGNVSAAGGFIWPATSYLVTSEYGWRIHPIQGENKFHSGVDIGAGAGTPIYAAASGTVATATYSNSYGNYVLISHGGGSSTLYAHMSSMAVSSGNVVSQGQVIGYVGSTGWSTGPHLHYEVRISGSTVNPLQYYSGYSIYNG